MNILLFDEYKQIIRSKILTMPRKGHGQIEKIAQILGVSQSFVSQIMNSEKNFSEEQAVLIARHFGFTDFESEYFLVLVQIARAQSVQLKMILNRHLNSLKKQNHGLDRNLKSLAEIDKEVFYSHWHYMAIWLLTAIPGLDSAEKIVKHLNLPLSRVNEVIEFLVHVGLCEIKNNKLCIKVLRTLVTRDSPTWGKHLLNWRLRAIEFLQLNPPYSLFYTQPMAISEKDAKVIKEILIKTISNIEPIVEPSPAESTFCLNIDWYKF